MPHASSAAARSVSAKPVKPSSPASTACTAWIASSSSCSRRSFRRVVADGCLVIEPSAPSSSFGCDVASLVSRIWADHVGCRASASASATDMLASKSILPLEDAPDALPAGSASAPTPAAEPSDEETDEELHGRENAAPDISR